MLCTFYFSNSVFLFLEYHLSEIFASGYKEGIVLYPKDFECCNTHEHLKILHQISKSFLKVEIENRLFRWER